MLFCDCRIVFLFSNLFFVWTMFSLLLLLAAKIFCEYYNHGQLCSSPYASVFGVRRPPVWEDGSVVYNDLYCIRLVICVACPSNYYGVPYQFSEWPHDYGPLSIVSSGGKCGRDVSVSLSNDN